MKEMIKRVREEKGGFTLAELLIVVAIVLVLVAIAIPVFTGALNQANDAVKAANERSVKAEATTVYLLQGKDAVPTTYYADDQGNISSDSSALTVKYTYDVVVNSSDPNNVQITVTQKSE